MKIDEKALKQAIKTSALNAWAVDGLKAKPAQISCDWTEMHERCVGQLAAIIKKTLESQPPSGDGV